MPININANGAEVTVKNNTQMSVNVSTRANVVTVSGGVIGISGANHVPYAGANNNVDLGDNYLKAETLRVDNLYTPTGDEPIGATYWNEVDGTIDIKLKNNTALQTGQELHFYGKANGNVLNGEVVQFAGVQGNHILVKKAVANEIDSHPEYLVGIATQNIDNNNFGYVTWFGKINGVYTNTPNNNDNQDWVVGDLLWLSFSTGQLTKTQPQAPTRSLLIASVIKAQSGNAENGIILIRPTFGKKLTDLNDVNGTPLTTTGQILVWDNDIQVFDFTENINDKANITTGSGAPVATPADGTLYVDTTNHRLYVRSGGTWKYTSLI